jgi:hypothetical protein
MLKKTGELLLHRLEPEDGRAQPLGELVDVFEKGTCAAARSVGWAEGTEAHDRLRLVGNRNLQPYRLEGSRRYLPRDEIEPGAGDRLARSRPVGIAASSAFESDLKILISERRPRLRSVVTSEWVYPCWVWVGAVRPEVLPAQAYLAAGVINCGFGEAFVLHGNSTRPPGRSLAAVRAR